MHRGDGPWEMGDYLPAVDLGLGRTAVDIAAGGSVTCARLDNGDLKCWGFNAVGALGQEDTNNRGDDIFTMGDNLPAIDLGTDRTAVEVAVGGEHICARLDNGDVKCWGGNSRGQHG
eukprot:339078_1